MFLSRQRDVITCCWTSPYQDIKHETSTRTRRQRDVNTYIANAKMKRRM